MSKVINFNDLVNKKKADVRTKVEEKLKEENLSYSFTLREGEKSGEFFVISHRTGFIDQILQGVTPENIKELILSCGKNGANITLLEAYKASNEEIFEEPVDPDFYMISGYINDMEQAYSAGVSRLLRHLFSQGEDGKLHFNYELYDYLQSDDMIELDPTQPTIALHVLSRILLLKNSTPNELSKFLKKMEEEDYIFILDEDNELIKVDNDTLETLAETFISMNEKEQNYYKEVEKEIEKYEQL